MSMLEPGRTFGHYTIINFDGTLGPIETYRAYESPAGRDVTLKVLAARDPAAAGRFATAAAALLDLAHPSILDMTDAGEVDGVHYLALPLVEGQTLAQRLLQGALTPGEIARIVENVTGALAYAHQRGLTSGALSLDRIVLDRGGKAILTDFAPGLLAAPGQGAELRARDLAMLGGVLIALLAGHAIGEPESALGQALAPWIGRLPPVAQAAAAEQYAQFAARVLSPDAAKRFTSVADFLAAWGQLVKPDAGGPSIHAASASDAAGIAAERQAAAAAQSQAQQLKYASEWQERMDARAREMREAQERLRREMAEREANLQRARQDYDSRLGPAVARSASVVAAPVDRARQAALRRLLRTVEAVAEKRASTIGLRPLTKVSPAPGAPHKPSAPPAARSAPHRTPAGPTAHSAVAHAAGTIGGKRQAAAAREMPLTPAAADMAAFGRRLRPIIGTLVIILFLMFCVVPLACVIWAGTLPEETPTPAVPAPTRASAAVSSPTAARVLSTATASARASAAPTVAMAIALTDTFQAGACALPERAGRTGGQLCADGEYRMSPSSADPLIALYEMPRGPMALEVDARVVTPSSALEYGLIWGASAEDHYNAFSLKADGAVAIFARDGSTIDYTMRGLTFSAVNGGTQVNRLRVTVGDERVTFAVNGRELPLSIGARPSPGGRLGLFARNGGQAGAIVAFANLSVSAPRMALTPALATTIAPTATRGTPPGPTAQPTR